jgi:NAD(P)-dependent dehydrogenase (short-subunit alcohol dehydrogenase family)
MDVQASSGTLIVTGASRGIGAAIATLAATRGFSVAVNFATGETEANAIAQQIISAGGHASAIQADVARDEDVIRLFATAERELGPIKALVNNAAITGGFARVESVTAATLAQGSNLVRPRGRSPHVDSARRNRRLDRKHFFPRRPHRLRRRVGALRRL